VRAFLSSVYVGDPSAVVAHPDVDPPPPCYTLNMPNSWAAIDLGEVREEVAPHADTVSVRV
jgi:hypothetical protein